MSVVDSWNISGMVLGTTCWLQPNKDCIFLIFIINLLKAPCASVHENTWRLPEIVYHVLPAGVSPSVAMAEVWSPEASVEAPKSMFSWKYWPNFRDMDLPPPFSTLHLEQPCRMSSRWICKYLAYRDHCSQTLTNSNVLLPRDTSTHQARGAEII